MPTSSPNNKPVIQKVSENTTYNRDAYKALMESKEVTTEPEPEIAAVQP
jgi:hypothetical protein